MDDGLEEAATDCCAPSAPKSEALHSCPTNACSAPMPCRADCGKKRDPRKRRFQNQTIGDPPLTSPPN